MPVVVDARSQEDFEAWLSEKKKEAEKIRELTNKDWNMDELMKLGKTTYDKICAACHQVGGQGIPPLFPALKGAEMAIKSDMLKDHVDIVVNGKKGTAMQAFANQLSEAEIAAVITYERNAWGNNTGEMVTPKQILEYKKTGKLKPDDSAKPVTKQQAAL